MPVPRLTPREWILLLGLLLGVNAAGALPAVFVGAETTWFDRPPLYPPEFVFPVAWTALFSLMAIGLFLVLRAEAPPELVRRALAVFGGQFALNLVWTPVFFGLRSPIGGLVVIVALWFAILLTIRVFDRVSRPAAALLVPYLAWVSFAAFLNAAIVLGG